MTSSNDELQLPSVVGDSPAVPAIAQPATPQLYDRVGAGDIQLPSIYLQQALSAGVKNGIAKPGDVILALGSDDPAPVHLIGGPEGRESFDAYILARKRFYATTRDGSIKFTPERDFDDPDSWEGFNYLVAVPEVDEVVPARMMLWRTAGRIASKRLNFFVDRGLASGSTDPVHVRFTVGTRTNKRGQEYYVLQPASIGAGEDIDVARAMSEYARYMQRGAEEGL